MGWSHLRIVMALKKIDLRDAVVCSLPLCALAVGRWGLLMGLLILAALTTVLLLSYLLGLVVDPQ